MTASRWRSPSLSRSCRSSLVTTVNGNTDVDTATRLTVDLLRRLDTEVEVVRGAACALLPSASGAAGAGPHAAAAARPHAAVASWSSGSCASPESSRWWRSDR